MLAAKNADVALQQLAVDGYAVVPDVLTPAETRDVRARLLQAGEHSEADGVPTRGYAFDPDGSNQRVFHLFNFDDVFVSLSEHPLARTCVESLIGKAYLISNFSANITAPGSARMQLHADQGYVLEPWPALPLACNVAWLLDDFTAENGGTCYVPGSHRLNHNPRPGEQYQTVPIVAPAGSVLVMDGRLWHQTGANLSADSRRAALFGYYVRRWLRPQINWNAALWPQTVARMSPAFLDRLGYYSGNVENQIPNGIRAAVPMPMEWADPKSAPFALGPQGTRTR